jgi:hypothetical protein
MTRIREGKTDGKERGSGWVERVWVRWVGIS